VYKTVEKPPLADLMLAFATVNDFNIHYSVISGYHDFWMADSISAILESMHSQYELVTKSRIQGTWHGMKMYTRNYRRVHEMVDIIREEKQKVLVSNIIDRVFFEFTFNIDTKER
jgi:hypothetical protein